MKVKELIEELKELNGELEITIVDGSNGSGRPRTINFGPHEEAWEYNKYDKERQDFSDIDTLEGESIVVMGYGFY